MSRTLQIAMILAIVGYFAVLLYLLKKKSLNLKYTLLWIFTGFFMLVLALFPQLLHLFAVAVGIYGDTNALFAAISFCIIMILMSLTAIVSKMNERIKQLSQYVALLEKRLRDMEADGDARWDKSQVKSISERNENAVSRFTIQC